MHQAARADKTIWIDWSAIAFLWFMLPGWAAAEIGEPTSSEGLIPSVCPLAFRSAMSLLGLSFFEAGPAVSPGAFCAAMSLAGPSSSEVATGTPTASAGGTEVGWAVGGCGGAYFLASPGPLVIDLYKRDLHQRQTVTELRAILAGPDRRVLQEVRIPDDGLRGPGPGPWQWARLFTNVQHKGIYVLNITVSNDRYGEEIAWGFQTNCPKYVVETARGHRDAPHEEPLVLLCPDQPGQIVFQPRPGEFHLEATGLPKEVQTVEVRDAQDRLVAAVSVDASGRAQHRFPGDKHRPNTPWRILLPKQQGTLHVDGLTRWQPDDPAPHIACWTPEPRSWFSWLENRWLLTPYRRLVYGQPGHQGTLRFEIHNNAPRPRKIQLTLEVADLHGPESSPPAGADTPTARGPSPAAARPAARGPTAAPGSTDAGKTLTLRGTPAVGGAPTAGLVRLSRSSVELGSRQAEEVLLHYTIPSNGQVEYFLRVRPEDDPDFSTYSSIRLIAGQAPCQKPLQLPLLLKPYEHENEQLGYLPSYPLDGQPYFDMENRPWVVSGGGLATCRQGRWQWEELGKWVARRAPDLAGKRVSSLTSKVAFDRDNHLYLVARVGDQAGLLHSDDGGQSFTFHALPPPGAQAAAEGQETFDMEEFTGHNVPDGPPPILRYRLIGRDPQHFWRWIHTLELIVADKKQDRLEFHPPVLVSRQCIGLSAHSGIPSSVVSGRGRVHLVWAEATDPAEKVPGVPTYVATYDRRSRQLSKPVLVSYGPPPNDVHNSPSITMDSRGFLHVLCGTHNRPFPYARSLQPNDTTGGWTEAKVVGEGLGQTYIGMVCGKDDSLCISYRLWQWGKPPHPLASYAALAFQRKPADGPWQLPQILVVPPFSEYSVYRHRLTIDRQGRLFLLYDYWSTHWFYRNDQREGRRALWVSSDSGQTWRLASGEDLWPKDR